MDRLVVLAMRVAQDFDTAPGGDAGDRDTDHQIGPIAAQQPDQTACDEKIPPFEMKSLRLNVLAARTFTSGSSSRPRSQMQMPLTTAAMSAMEIMSGPSGSEPV